MNEFQMAHEMSRLTIERPNETVMARFLSTHGFYVVMRTYLMFCPVTDGMIGSATVIDEVFHTHEEAKRHAFEDKEFGEGPLDDMYIFGELPEAPLPDPVPDEEIPF
jgi:hypothetical protein